MKLPLVLVLAVSAAATAVWYGYRNERSVANRVRRADGTHRETSEKLLHRLGGFDGSRTREPRLQTGEAEGKPGAFKRDRNALEKATAAKHGTLPRPHSMRDEHVREDGSDAQGQGDDPRKQTEEVGAKRATPRTVADQRESVTSAGPGPGSAGAQAESLDEAAAEVEHEPLVVPYSPWDPTSLATIPAALAVVDDGMDVAGSTHGEAAADDFLNRMAEAASTPDDPEYQRAWMDAQEASDIRLRAGHGGHAWLMRHREAYRQTAAESQPPLTDSGP